MIPVERSEVRFGLTRIPYSIRRSGRRATVAITIDPEAGVVLTAPAETPVERLDRVVHAKGGWIIEKLRRKIDLPPPLPEREFVGGETFLYLGRQYRLRLERLAGGGEEGAAKGRGAAAVGLRRGYLVVALPGAVERTARAEQVKSALIDWYFGRATERLPERAALWAEQLAVPEPRVVVRDQRKRWGSCDARGTLRFNWRLIQAPMRLVDYVVAHELVHLEHPDHTADFWAALGRAMPDYEARRGGLRKIGRMLTW
jgi:hypothetical protein